MAPGCDRILSNGRAPRLSVYSRKFRTEGEPRREIAVTRRGASWQLAGWTAARTVF
jgi:hypothetical protein